MNLEQKIAFIHNTVDNNFPGSTKKYLGDSLKYLANYLNRVKPRLYAERVAAAALLTEASSQLFLGQIPIEESQGETPLERIFTGDYRSLRGLDESEWKLRVNQIYQMHAANPTLRIALASGQDVGTIEHTIFLTAKGGYPPYERVTIESNLIVEGSDPKPIFKPFVDTREHVGTSAVWANRDYWTFQNGLGIITLHNFANLKEPTPEESIS